VREDSPTQLPSRLGLVGLGEVGLVLAAELLRAGRSVRCLETRPERSAILRSAATLGIEVDISVEAFAAQVDGVLVAVQGRAALGVAAEVVPCLRSGVFYADLTAKGIAARDEIGRLCSAGSVIFADVAIVDTVMWPDRTIDLIVSGPGAVEVVSALEGTRFSCLVADPARPISTEIKLCRSVFTKGLMALLLETLAAAERSGVEAYVRQTLINFMSEDPDRIVSLLIGTSMKHARRRTEEMAEAMDFVTDRLGAAPMAAASRVVLEAVAQEADHSALDGWQAVIEYLIDRKVFDRIPLMVNPRTVEHA